MYDKIVVNGMLWGKVEPLVAPIDYDDFTKMMLDALGREKEHFRADADHALSSFATKEAFEFRAPNLNDPLEVKWALLLPLG